MFGQNTNELSYSDFQLHQYYIPPPEPPFLSIPPELGYTSSGCSSYGGSPTNYGPLISSHSEPYYPFELDETTSFRKTGDLTGQHGQRSISPVAATESSIIESMNRANPYSPEEKKERIERYRNKRNLRNFNKKIKYECRKTLADSRPRIRGRFARNDEIESTDHNTKSMYENDQSQIWNLSRLTGVEEYDEDDQNWIGFLDEFSETAMP